MNSLEETLDLLAFRIQAKQDTIREIRYEMKTRKQFLSFNQLLAMRNRKKTLLREIEELQIQYDKLNPENT